MASMTFISQKQETNSKSQGNPNTERLGTKPNYLLHLRLV